MASTFISCQSTQSQNQISDYVYICLALFNALSFLSLSKRLPPRLPLVLVLFPVLKDYVSLGGTAGNWWRVA